MRSLSASARAPRSTLMGQNGAGKSTIFGLINGVNEPENGVINIVGGTTIATSRQVNPRDEMDLTVREFFQKQFKQKVYDIDPKIDDVLEVVNLVGHAKVHDRVIRTFSGGQQARLLLASALITDPDLLLLDEPTNNLDKAGIEHLTKFLVDYTKTVIVISHDAEFLNSFSDAVLYLDLYTRKIEYYVGNYNNVLKDITARVEKENMKNAQLAKQIQAKKDKSNEFAHKGGRLRLVAKRMKELAEDLEEEMVDVRKERQDHPRLHHSCAARHDRGDCIGITSLSMMKNHKIVEREIKASLKKNQHLLLKGPNGIGKTTLLESVARGTAKGAKIQPGIRVGYYRQDFGTLDFEQTPFQALKDIVMKTTGRFERRAHARRRLGFSHQRRDHEHQDRRAFGRTERPRGLRQPRSRSTGPAHPRRADQPHQLPPPAHHRQSTRRIQRRDDTRLARSRIRRADTHPTRTLDLDK